MNTENSQDGGGRQTAATWKFWLWPAARKIRQLERELFIANLDRKHFVAALEKQRIQTKETWRQYAAEVEKRLKAEESLRTATEEMERRLRGMHRSHA